VLSVLRLLFWSAALVGFLLAALPQPPQLPGVFDKVEHFLGFACLAMLGSAAYPRLAALKLILGLSVFGALIEVVQMFPSLHRRAEFLDWVADTAGAVAGVLAVRVWRHTRKAPRPADR
jgi:VanZ family protein